MNVTVGKTKRLEISYSPESASAKKITWESSNNNIATVSSSGIVKGIAEGEAIVTATTDNGIKATADIVVLPLPASVSLPSTLTIYVGYSKTLTPSVSPTNSETSYTWKSSDSSIATVSSGKITGSWHNNNNCYNRKWQDCEMQSNNKKYTNRAKLKEC